VGEIWDKFSKFTRVFLNVNPQILNKQSFRHAFNIFDISRKYKSDVFVPENFQLYELIGRFQMQESTDIRDMVLSLLGLVYFEPSIEGSNRFALQKSKNSIWADYSLSTDQLYQRVVLCYVLSFLSRTFTVPDTLYSTPLPHERQSLLSVLFRLPRVDAISSLDNRSQALRAYIETLRNILKLSVSSATRLSSEQICHEILAYASRATDMVMQGDMPAFSE
jgi:hypothetical protein